MDRYVRAFLFALTVLWPGLASAEITVTRIDTSHYPAIEATVEVPGADIADRPTFVLYENYGSDPKAQEMKAVVPAVENATNWVVVLDATKSVPKKDFGESKQAALEFVRDLPDSDRVAVFRINGEPIEILSMTPLSTQRADVLKGIEEIERTGLKTRIYDALYVGLDHATRSREAFRARASAVILFTDGRDEGSYLSEEDAIAIAGEAREARIPVFTILNGDAKGEERFQKVALKTGGQLFRGRFPEEKLRPPPDSVARFAIRYESSARVWEAFPGSRVTLQVEYINDNGSTSEMAYKVPFRFWNGEHGLLPWLFIGLGLLLLIAFFVMLWIVLRRATIRRKLPPVSEEVMDGWKPDRPAPRSPSPEEEPPGQITDYTEALARSQNPDARPATIEERSDWSDPEGPGHSGDAGYVREKSADAAVAVARAEEEGARMRMMQAEMPLQRRTPETISLELKEKSYQVLQMALRDAPRYDSAMLVLIGGDPYRQKNEYDLFLEETYMGRSPMASLVVADKSASMLHGKIRRIDQRYVLFDLVSDAGTFLNGRRVLRPRPLRNGDEIQMGHTRFEFRGRSVS
jgi:Mg-chelatase subunit ChlD